MPRHALWGSSEPSPPPPSGYCTTEIADALTWAASAPPPGSYSHLSAQGLEQSRARPDCAASGGRQRPRVDGGLAFAQALRPTVIYDPGRGQLLVLWDGPHETPCFHDPGGRGRQSRQSGRRGPERRAIERRPRPLRRPASCRLQLPRPHRAIHDQARPDGLAAGIPRRDSAFGAPPRTSRAGGHPAEQPSSPAARMKLRRLRPSPAASSMRASPKPTLHVLPHHRGLRHRPPTGRIRHPAPVSLLSGTGHAQGPTDAALPPIVPYSIGLCRLGGSELRTPRTRMSGSQAQDEKITRSRRRFAGTGPGRRRLRRREPRDWVGGVFCGLDRGPRGRGRRAGSPLPDPAGCCRPRGLLTLPRPLTTGTRASSLLGRCREDRAAQEKAREGLTGGKAARRHH